MLRIKTDKNMNQYIVRNQNSKMLNAGIVISSDVVKLVGDVHGGSKDFALFKIKDSKSMVHVGSFPEEVDDIETFNNDKNKEANWKDRVYQKFFDRLKSESEPVYVVLDFRYVTDSQKRTKLIFIGWCPDKSTVKQRMLFSSTFRQFADKVNIPIRITAHCPADITYDELLAKSEKF